ncbi:MAG TPA: hypothetical protein VGM23_13085 [Armatimonadota bacterium]|jgi:hypothetical protein
MSNRYRTILAAGILLLLGTAVMASPRAIDLLALGASKGLNAPLPYRPFCLDASLDDCAFLPYQQAITHAGGLTVLSVPKDDLKARFRYTGIGPIPIKALSRYTLAFRVSMVQK